MGDSVATRRRWQYRLIKLLSFLAPNLTGAAVGSATLYQLADGAQMLDWIIIALIAAVGFAACGACGRLQWRWYQEASPRWMTRGAGTVTNSNTASHAHA
jgi:hypothetical protein